MSFKNFRPFSQIMKNKYLCIQQGSLSIFLTPFCSRKSKVSAINTITDLQFTVWTKILNILSAQQLLNFEEVLILLQIFMILATLHQNYAFQNYVSAIMYWTILQRPSFTYLLYLMDLLFFYFYLYSQLEFSMTDSISWIMDKFRLAFGMTESYTFSMLFFRKSGSYYYSQLLSWLDSCISFCGFDSSTKSDYAIPFLINIGSNFAEFSSKVAMISSSNFLLYTLYLKL